MAMASVQELVLGTEFSVAYGYFYDDDVTTPKTGDCSAADEGVT